MVSKALKYWNYVNRYTGIEVTSMEGGDAFFWVTGKIKKGEFTQLDFWQADGLSHLSRQLGKNTHAQLTINTDKVLIKQVPREGIPEKALSKAFPGLSPSDFYYEVVDSGEHSHVAVCRRDEVIQWVEQAKVNQIEVIGVRLGFSAIAPLLGYVKGERLVLNRHLLELNGDSIGNVRQSEGPSMDYTIENVHCPSTHLLSLASLFGYVQGPTSRSNLDGFNSLLRKGQIEKNLFRKGLAVGAALLLLVLLANMFFFTEYRKEYLRLKEEQELASGQREQLRAKAEKVGQKEKLVRNILSAGNSKSSFYLNRTVSQLPGSIRLTEFTYQPLLKSIRTDQAIEYNEGTLKIKGESLDKDLFSQWITTLEALDWVGAVTVSNYGANGSREDIFEITLILRDDAKE